MVAELVVSFGNKGARLVIQRRRTTTKQCCCCCCCCSCCWQCGRCTGRWRPDGRRRTSLLVASTRQTRECPVHRPPVEMSRHLSATAGTRPPTAAEIAPPPFRTDRLRRFPPVTISPPHRSATPELLPSVLSQFCHRPDLRPDPRTPALLDRGARDLFLLLSGTLSGLSRRRRRLERQWLGF